jgi:hypothetical protein
LWDDTLRFLDEMQADGITPNKVTIISLLLLVGMTRLLTGAGGCMISLVNMESMLMWI